SARSISRGHSFQRPIYGAAPALVASSSTSFQTAFYEVSNILAAVESAQGKGVVIVGTHVGSLGITPAMLVQKGLRVLILRDQQFESLVNTRHGRQFFLGAEPVFLDINQPNSVNRAMIRCAKALREGAVIAYTADARHGSHYRTGKVFG